MTTIDIEPWMREIPDKYYGDECFRGHTLLHPHFMKYSPFNQIVHNQDIHQESARIKGSVNSMLNPHTLTLVRHLASISTGTVLEIGAFTGGATISMAKGLLSTDSSSRFISVEIGKNINNQVLSYDHHVPGLSSDNLFAKLTQNLSNYGVDHRVDSYEASSRDPDFVNKTLTPYLKDNPLGLVVIDADGHIQKDLDILEPYMVPGCYIVVDDYMMHSRHTGNANKAIPSQKAVHNLVNSGKAISLGVYLWNTWFGQII